MQHRFTLAPVRLARLLLVERLHVRILAARIGAVARHRVGQPGRRVAVARHRAHAQAVELLAGPRGLERRALHRAHLDLDADRAEVARDRLAGREVRRIGIEIAGVEAVRVAGFREELFGLCRIVGIGLERQRELELARHHRAGQPRGAERLGLVERSPIDGHDGGQPHAPIVPGRFRIPLIEEVQVVDADRPREGQPDRRVALELERGRRVEHVRHVHLAVLQHGRAGRGVRHRLEHEPLHRRRLAPVALVGLHDQLDPGGVAHELVGPEPDRPLLEAVVADALDVLLRHDPGGARGQGAVEGHEVGEGLVQVEAHPRGADDLDVAHPLFQDLADLRALEAEPHVLGGEGIAVVELDALAQLELVDLLVGAHRPRFGEARRHEIAGHRLHERVVHRVEDPERRDEARGRLARVEPGRRQSHVERPAHLAFGLRRGRRLRLRRGVRDETDDKHRREHESDHGRSSPFRSIGARRRPRPRSVDACAAHAPRRPSAVPGRRPDRAAGRYGRSGGRAR